MFGFSREAIRVKVKKCEGSLPVEFRKFSVDPQITSFEVLQSILAKAFDLKGDFAICYRIDDGFDNGIYMPLVSDWDLDAAFLKAQNISLVSKTEPCLCLRVDLKPFEECSDDFEIRQPVAAQNRIKPLVPLQEIKQQPRLHGIFNQVGKTINLMQRAFNFGEDVGNNTSLQYIPKAPLSDAEFRRYLDPVGQIINAKELRSCIYFGGIEPSLRKVVWKHLLNVYPKGMTGKERMDYIKKKALEYYSLREIWKTAIAQGSVDGELAYTTGMVKKDVLRTDRHHEFYAGNDDNQNIASLFNILTTYALNHPKVSYCQGMSDLASPLLVTMNDEAHAYICFCALMERLSTNFMIDGIAMTQKFTHLSEAIMYYDPEFYNYLKMHQADDLLFCYRWLLLEMKREFAFEDSLRMLEVLWSSLPADPPAVELKLFDVKFQLTPLSTPPISPLVKTPRENAYSKVCAIRRRSSSMSLNSFKNKRKLDKVKRLNQSLDEMLTKSKNLSEIKPKQQSLDDAALSIRIKENSPKKSRTPKSPKTPKPSETSPVLEGSNEVGSEALNHLTKPEPRARSVSPLEQKSDSAVILNNHINTYKTNTKVRSSSLSSSMSSLNKNKKKGGNHFRELKAKIATSKIFCSLDQLESCHAKEESENKPPKLIKNFNEFLHFATVNKNKISDKISKIGNDNSVDNPKITLTKSSLDDSDASSIDQNSSNFSKSRCMSTTSCSGDDTFEDYSPDEYFPLTTSVTRELRLEMDNLDRKVFGDHFNDRLIDSSPSECSSDYKTEKETEEVNHITNKVKDIQLEKAEEILENKRCDDVFIWENPLHQSSPSSQKLPSCEIPKSELDLNSEIPSIVNEVSASKTVTPIRIVNYTQSSNNVTKIQSVPIEPSVGASPEEPPQCLSIENIIKVNGADMTNSCEEVTENAKSAILPPPDEFGGGNPFLMFLCITVLLQHRDHIIEKGMDYNEMAMHFDKMIRRHNVISVLNQARQMYGSYMKKQSLMLGYHKT
ncbi:TBC1 domain family member 25 isoform X2 [Coccinella septempunctata]|uniref:TBC1 domain family member 25 isoform X2 n=1 Tax=Coccinella septempunctata TaxID=41139 RepID=UPI001D06400C|nr:TBC1 domain family member 25 isoform X2 [Coccinella septempunctata]